MQKSYTKGDLTVNWNPSTCIHAGKCVKNLPNVFKPKEKPWVDLDAAAQEEVIEAIKQCPSGALSYFLRSEKPKATLPTGSEIQVLANGPLIVNGPCTVLDKDGKKQQFDKRVALCRCGHSANKPFCDGAHKSEGFVG